MADILGMLGKRQTTLFVGDISESLSNDQLNKLFQSCGDVRRWKRIVDPDGSEKPFGFIEYEHPDSVLRAIRIIPSIQTVLTLKMDEATQAYIKKYERVMRERTTREKRKQGIELDRKAIEKIKEILNETPEAKLEEPEVNENDLFVAYRERERQWESEEARIDRRVRQAREEASLFAKELERAKRDELAYLATYDDDLVNDLYHTDRKEWRLKRASELAREGIEDAPTIEVGDVPLAEGDVLIEKKESDVVLEVAPQLELKQTEPVVVQELPPVAQMPADFHAVRLPTQQRTAVVVPSFFDDSEEAVVTKETLLQVNPLFKQTKIEKNSLIYGWIREKLKLVLGFEESSLTQFVVDKLNSSKVTAKSMVESLKTALDEDAVQFVFDLYKKLE